MRKNYGKPVQIERFAREDGNIKGLIKGFIRTATIPSLKFIQNFNP